MTEEREIELGNAIAKILMLQRDRDNKDRWQTTWGNKTALGLWRTVERIVDVARNNSEVIP